MKVLIMLLFVVTLFLCFFGSVFVQGSPVHHSVVAVPSHAPQFVTSVLDNTETNENATASFTYNSSPEIVIAVTVSLDAGNVIYAAEYTHRLIFSTCSAETLYDTFLTLVNAQPGDDLTSVDLSNPDVYMASDGDYNCQTDPMGIKAASIVYDSSSLGADALLYVIIEGYDDAVGQFNLSVINCGTSCLEYDLSPTCSCAVCADGFALEEDGTCVLVACVDYASNAPACTCDEDYTDSFSWNMTTGSWDGLCVADCSGAPDCGGLQREECLLTAHACSECLPGFVANGTDDNETCLPCADENCLSCTDAQEGSCQVCENSIEVIDGFCDSCIHEATLWNLEEKLLGSVAAVDAWFGQNVRLNEDGTVCAIGAAGSGSGTGFVDIFKISERNSVWVNTATLVPEDGQVGDQFGTRISIAPDGTVVAVGSLTHDLEEYSNAGSVYVFQETSNNNWTQIMKLVSTDPAAFRRFGAFIVLSQYATRIFVCSESGDGSITGSCDMFEQNDASDYQHLEELVPGEAISGSDRYGIRADMSYDGSFVIVGAFGVSSERGAAYCFVETGSGSWEESAKLTANDASAGDRFGWGLSLDRNGRNALISSYQDDGGVGSMYIFSSSDFYTWEQDAHIKPSAGVSNFGVRCELSNNADIVLMGTYQPGLSSSVLVYHKKVDGWYLHAVLSDGSDFSDGYYGNLVVLSYDGKVAAVAAYRDDTVANGNGAVYVYAVDCAPPVFSSCPQDYVLVSDSDITLHLSINATDLFDPDPAVLCDPSLESVFIVSEESSVLCTATDNNNNIETCDFVVSVYPTDSALVVSCPQDVINLPFSYTLLSPEVLNVNIVTISEMLRITYDIAISSDSTEDSITMKIFADEHVLESVCENVRVETHGDCIWEYVGDDTWLTCPPSIGANTLRKVAETSGASSLLGLNADGGSIAFDGKHLYTSVTDDTIVTVWFGDFTTGNVRECESAVATGTSISCNIPPLDETWTNAQNLQFQVNVTSLINGMTLSSQLSSDVYHYPVAPNITAVHGCGSIKNATGCRTVGGDVITIIGYDLDLANRVAVDGLDCDIQVHIDDNTLTCTLPATDGANRAVVAYQNSVVSEQAFLVSYAVPNVLSVSGCPSNTTTSTFNCPDEPVDGQVITLTITGTDFGSEVSAVFIGTQQSLSVETYNDSIIYCTLPKGGGEDNSIMIVQKNGQVAVAQKSFVSYEPCPDGTYLNGAECDPCEAGYYTNDKTIKTQCVACNLGEYQDQTGQTDCKDCDAGRFSEQLATNYSCTDCPIGTFSLNGASECRGCSADTQYAPEEGMDACINCPPRAVRRSDDVSQCWCDTLFYWDTLQSDTELVCEPCDTRWYNCSQPGYTLETLILMPGYWRSSSSIYEPEECFSPEMCPGGAFDASLTAEDDDELCAFPRTGPMCAQCVPGYIADALTSPCEECMDSSLQLLFFIIAGFVALMFCGYYVHKTLKKADKEKGELSTLVKITLSAFQINSIAISFAFVWEGAFNDFIAAESAASSLGTSALNFSCLILSDGDGLKAVFIETLLYLLSGVFVSVVPNLFLVPYLYFTSARVDVLVDVKENLINIYRVALPIVFFLLHPTLTQRTMNLFHCTDINGTLYMTQQLDEECWEGDHLAWVFSAGILMIVFYVLGLPLTAVYFLYKHQDKIHADHPDHTTFHRNYSFLYKGYAVDTIGKDHYAWAWEAVVTARKVFLMFILVFFANDAHLQSLLGLLGMMIALSTHAYAMPFESSLLNAAEFISLLCSFITFYLGQFTYVQDTDPDVRLTASWMALIVNVGFLLVMLGFMIYSAKEKRDAKKEVERIRAQSEAAGDRLEDDDIKNFGDKGSDRRRKATLEFRQLRHERANSQQQFRIRGFTTDLKDIEMTTITEEKSVVHDDVAMSVDELKQDHEPEPVLDTPSTPAVPIAAVEATALPDGWTEHPSKSGKPYYYHTETEETTWMRPE